MEERTLKGLQSYLEYIRYNTTNFGLRLLRPFSVYHYVYSQNKYRVFFDNERNDSYWIEGSEYNKFLAQSAAYSLIYSVLLAVGFQI